MSGACRHDPICAAVELEGVTDWSRLVVPAVAELEPLDIEQTAADVALLATHENGLKLDWNENLFGPLPGVREAVRDELESVWLYPIGPYHAFRADVARVLETTPERIAPGHGTQALIGTVASTFLRPGDRVVLPEVTFYLYAQVSAARGAILHRVPMRDLRIDLDAIADTAHEVDARLVWICDPNNPTGLRLDPAEWTMFLDSLPPHCVVVADEAYVDYLPPASRAPRIAEVEGGRPLVVLRSFSKFYALAGLRLGYAVADEALVARFAVVEEPFNVNCAALAAGRASVLAIDAAERRRQEVAEARSALADGFREAGAEPYPSETNFVLARIHGDDELVAAELARRGILVRPGSELGLERHIRVAVAPAHLVERITAELRAALTTVGG
jgi:histidinol-phosphate aminotransferase